MERQCSAAKPNGVQCLMLTRRPDGLCQHHAPEFAERRARTASRGGRGNADRETRNLKGELRDLRARVDSGDLDPTKANTMIRCISAEVDVIRLERQVHLEDNLEREIEELKRERSNPA